LAFRIDAQISPDVWQPLASLVTDATGRATLPSAAHTPIPAGIYRLQYQTGVYFAQQKLSTLFPYIEVVVDLQANQRFHLPLLITPHSYSTYRGS
jgi:5-hydroxyisourate hydrolase